MKTKLPKISLGGTDPKTKKGQRENAKFLKIAMRSPSKLRAAPMPEWAIEEAISDGKRHAAKGWKPLATIYREWNLARQAYLAQFLNLQTP